MLARQTRSPHQCASSQGVVEGLADAQRERVSAFIGLAVEFAPGVSPQKEWRYSSPQSDPGCYRLGPAECDQ